jgi:hypothetical protein
MGAGLKAYFPDLKFQVIARQTRLIRKDQKDREDPED